MNEKKVKEAIEYLKLMLFDMVEMRFKHVPKYYKTAIEALEKQLQKKPVLKRNAYGGISVCPICGASDYGKYCRQCGQKFERSEIIFKFPASDRVERKGDI